MPRNDRLCEYMVYYRMPYIFIAEDVARKYPFVTHVLLAGAGKDYTFHRYAELALADMLLAFYGPLQKFDTNSLPPLREHDIL